MFRLPDYPDAPLGHSSQRDYLRTNAGLAPVADTLALGASAVDVTLAAYTTTLVSATSGAQFNLPDGAYPGQRKHLVASVSGSGTCVASAAALAKMANKADLTKAATAFTMTSSNKYALLEWTGAKWIAAYADATSLTYAT